MPEPGTSYDQCTRVQSIYPTPLPNPSTGAPILLRLENGGIDTYCNSNAVFHYTSTASNGSTTTCTEANAAAAAINPAGRPDTNPLDDRTQTRFTHKPTGDPIFLGHAAGAPCGLEAFEQLFARRQAPVAHVTD